MFNNTFHTGPQTVRSGPEWREGGVQLLALPSHIQTVAGRVNKNGKRGWGPL